MLHCLILFVLVSSIEHLRYIYPNQTTIVFLLTLSQSHEIEYRTTTAKHNILGLRIKMLPYQYTTWHCGNQTIVRRSYFYNGIFYTGKMVSLYWNQPCIAYGRTWKWQNLDVITLRHIISIFHYVYMIVKKVIFVFAQLNITKWRLVMQIYTCVIIRDVRHYPTQTLPTVK